MIMYTYDKCSWGRGYSCCRAVQFRGGGVLLLLQSGATEGYSCCRAVQLGGGHCCCKAVQFGGYCCCRAVQFGGVLLLQSAAVTRGVLLPQSSAVGGGGAYCGCRACRLGPAVCRVVMSQLVSSAVSHVRVPLSHGCSSF